MHLKIALAMAMILAGLSAAVKIPLTLRHRDLQKAISRGGSVLAAAKTTSRALSEQEGNFLINVTIGTPPQPFRLLVSHDSSVTYVLGATCVSGVCPDHAKYDYTKSTTANGYPKDANIKVGTVSNTAQAFPANDNIQIGDITIRQATFAVAVSDELTVVGHRDEIHYDGVLGLGTFKASNTYTKPVLSTAVSQKALDKSLYTIWLQRQNGGDCETANTLLPVVGILTLGDFNQDKCANAIDWHPLLDPYSDGDVFDYTTKVDYLKYGEHTYTLDTSIRWTAHFDASFSQVLFAPSEITDDIAKRAGAKVIIDEYKNRYYPISCAAKPDDVRLVMDGNTYVIPGRYLIDRYYNASDSCSLQIIASDEDTSSLKAYQFRLGSPFLREYCQTYDADHNQIGFSKNADASAMDTARLCGAPAPPPTAAPSLQKTTTPHGGSSVNSLSAVFTAIMLALCLMISQ